MARCMAAWARANSSLSRVSASRRSARSLAALARMTSISVASSAARSEYGNPVGQHLGITTHDGHMPQVRPDPEAQFPYFEFREERNMIAEHTEFPLLAGCDHDIHRFAQHRFFRGNYF